MKAFTVYLKGRWFDCVWLLEGTPEEYVRKSLIDSGYPANITIRRSI